LPVAVLVPYRAGTGNRKTYPGTTNHPDTYTREVTLAMEMTKYRKATARAAAFHVVIPMSLLPVQPLSTTGGVRPVTVTFTADEHNVRTWSPPV
jgi:hypothetical protein